MRMRPMHYYSYRPIAIESLAIYLCAADAVLGEHGLVEGHQPSLSGRSAGPGFECLAAMTAAAVACLQCLPHALREQRLLLHPLFSDRHRSARHQHHLPAAVVQPGHLHNGAIVLLQG